MLVINIKVKYPFVSKVSNQKNSQLSTNQPAFLLVVILPAYQGTFTIRELSVDKPVGTALCCYRAAQHMVHGFAVHSAVCMIPGTSYIICVWCVHGLCEPPVNT